jgi:nucleoside phosphorylase
VTRSGRLEEDPVQACVSIVHFLLGEGDPWKRDLLLTDFANRMDALQPDTAERLRELALNSCLPGDREVGAIGAVMGARGRRPENVDVVITTVTPLEWRAAQAVFRVDESALHRFGGRRYYEFELPSRRAERNLKVVLTSILRPLNVRATKAMFQIRGQFEADTFVLLGIAAGREGEVELGDVVVPESVLYYPPGRSLPRGKLPRHGHPEVPEEVQANLHYWDPKGTGYHQRYQAFVKGLAARDKPNGKVPRRKPEVTTTNAIIASGEQLIQDGLLKRLYDFDERLVAGDQEAFGFAEALSDTRWAIFRGISDFGEPEKPHAWQYVAVAAAGLALRDFLETEYSPPDENGAEEVAGFV